MSTPAEPWETAGQRVMPMTGSATSGEDEPSCAIEDEGSLVRLIDLYGEHLVTKVTKT